MSKIGRNQLCPCGSGKKYKHCCGNPLKMQQATKTMPTPQRVQAMFREIEAKEQTRIQQQGRGRPIISIDHADHKMVAVGSVVHFSKKWKYFPDFLMDYIKKKLDPEWGNVELKKAFEDRHPLMQWYHLLCHFQAQQKKDANGHFVAKANGLSNCYLGTAYNLYLLDHNVELQERYIARIKDAKQFQGAYYELLVASCLIRSGFELELENEADLTQKHCEFSAISKRTGKKYWVEAKMRSVSGVLGKTDADGQPATSKPTGRLSTHLREALKKPASDDRIVFIDLNTTPMRPEDFKSGEPLVPKWMDAAEKQLEARERELKDGESAYVFVTNFCFHNALQETFAGHAALTYGLGIDDYFKPIHYTLKDAWRVKQKHIDMFDLKDSLHSYPQIPNSFDGDLPPVAPGDRDRVKIGQAYDFEGTGVVGVVTSATVVESEKKIYIAVHGQDGKSCILTEDISDQELEVYRAYQDTYFGVVQPVSKDSKTPYEFFEWMLGAYKDTPKDKFIEWMKGAPDWEELKHLSQEELALEYCERATYSAMSK
ncbi:MAG: SEC-C domain-containing protein [Rhodospirillales bacterium]|nr:SEC-C domain-containing protein [Rhodospirillales bacterium]